jgi:hypothetical protein
VSSAELATANARIEELLDEKADLEYDLAVLEQKVELLREEVGVLRAACCVCCVLRAARGGGCCLLRAVCCVLGGRVCTRACVRACVRVSVAW